MIFVALIAGYGVGVFAASNILLPLLWSRRRAVRLLREGRLKQPIPVAAFLIPPAVWTIAVVGSWVLVSSMFPAYSLGYGVGLLIAAAQTSRLVVKPSKDMEADFAAAYAAYLR